VYDNNPISYLDPKQLGDIIVSEQITKLDKHRKNDLLRKYCSILGDRIRLIITGGAPISPDVIKWLHQVWSQVLKDTHMDEMVLLESLLIKFK